jgi:hypothetical protein
MPLSTQLMFERADAIARWITNERRARLRQLVSHVTLADWCREVSVRA